MDKKIKNVSFIKTIMMTVIVLYHSMMFFGEKWFYYVNPIYEAKYLYYIARWMNTFHVQVFTMASGFLFYYLKKEKNKYNCPKKDIKKRAQRLLVPFIFTLLLWVLPIAVYFFKYSNKEIINKYILMTAPNQLWFLLMLFMVFLFFEFFSDKVKITMKNLIIIYITTTIIGLGLSHFNFNYFQIANAAKYIFYFYLGGFIYQNKYKITSKQTVIMIILALLLYVGIIYVDSLNINILRYGALMVEPIISMLEVSSIYYLCTILVDQKKINMNNKVYKVLEDNSFGIYLFHQQIIYFTIILFNGVVHPIIQVLLSFIISLSISILISFLLKKNKVTKFMFGL